MDFHEKNPYGSARLADPGEVLRAFNRTGGVPIGFVRGRMLQHAKNAGALLIGGAGSGKFVTVLAHILADAGRGKGQPPRYAILDPKGEMAAVIGPGLVQRGAHVYTVNPYGLHGLPRHSLALFAHLVPGSRSLVADARRVARTVFPESEGGNARFFEQKAQNWADAALRALVHADGAVSPLSLYELFGVMRARPDDWAQMSEHMAALGEPDLGVTFAEMREMAAGARRTYEGVIAEMGNALAFMTDPALQRSFTGRAEADFALDVLTEDSDRPVFVFLMMPAELIAQNAALIRQFFSALRTLKQREPQAPAVNLVIDEAARCVHRGDPTTESMNIRPAIPRTSDHPFQPHPTGMI